MRPKIKALLFDLDGTIIDSEKLGFEAIIDCARGWGVKIKEQDAALIAGRKWDVAFDHLMARYKIPLGRQQMALEILERYHEKLQSDVRAVPGVVDAIRDLRQKYRLALVSGSFRRDILFALEHLGIKDSFEVILGAEDYERSKPAPDGFIKAQRLLDVPPHECIVWEDSLAGIQSGKDSGSYVIAVTATNHFRHDQTAAHRCIENFEGITAAWLEEWLSSLS
jgi:HAD superfamily hydrolase (TIGR01509 family)